MRLGIAMLSRSKFLTRRREHRVGQVRVAHGNCESGHVSTRRFRVDISTITMTRSCWLNPLLCLTRASVCLGLPSYRLPSLASLLTFFTHNTCDSHERLQPSYQLFTRAEFFSEEPAVFPRPFERRSHLLDTGSGLSQLSRIDYRPRVFSAVVFYLPLG